MATKKAATANVGAGRVLQPTPRRGQDKPSVGTRKPARARVGRPRIQPRRAQTDGRTPMSIDQPVAAAEPLEGYLRERIIGQDGAVDALVGSWARLLSGLRDPERPLLTGLLLGPTGVGKTETARALAEAMFGSVTALHRINCEEYAQGHEVAKLLGSPPGYVGADIDPLLSQQRVDRPHWLLRQEGGEDAGEPGLIEEIHDPDRGLHSIILFDEVEKAHPTLWNALLGILEEGQVTLGNNKTTDLTRAIILMTSNVGSREMSAALDGVPLGFGDASRSSARRALGDIAVASARSAFPAEFLNRFDEVLVYEPLATDDLGRIYDKFLSDINDRAAAQAGVPLLLRTSEEAKSHVIDAGTDPALGARPLRRAMERLLVDPVSRLLASGQVEAGDVVEVEFEGTDLGFYRLPREADTVVA